MALLPSFCVRSASAASRPLSTSAASFRLRDKFLWESDMDKRPSELEIKQKKLPPNTPTLGMHVLEIKSANEPKVLHGLDLEALILWGAQDLICEGK